MLQILAKRYIHALADFAASNVLLAFDYDGTLAPIVTDPAAARMRASTRRLLTSVSRRYPCVVISGRARDDLARRIANIPLFHLSGNHGLEPWDENGSYRTQVQEWVRQLRHTLEAMPGVSVEDKTYSVTVHYRRAKRPAEAAAAVGRALRRLRGARSLGGKCAVSLVPRGAPTKGAALERVRRLLACDTAIYVGDDQTDEDAFSGARPDRLLGIRVGGRGKSGARYCVKTQAQVDDLLRALIAFRPLARGRR